MIPLTPRQTEVLKSIARAKVHKQIASDLGISKRTVEKHRDAIYHKTGVHTNVGLTHWAILNGLVATGDFER